MAEANQNQVVYFSRLRRPRRASRTTGGRWDKRIIFGGSELSFTNFCVEIILQTGNIGKASMPNFRTELAIW